MVLLVPDDIPEESLATTIKGNVEEMCLLFQGWDPRLVLLLMTIWKDLIITVTGFKNYSSYASQYKNGAYVSDLETSIGPIHPEHG
jgi:hypothetical protein